MSINDERLVWLKQMHSSTVRVIGTGHPSSKYSADAVVCIIHRADAPVISVHTADCVPILLVDPKKRITAAVHAGWRGTLREITGVTVRSMINVGSDVSDILASIGPHIGMCCYHVPMGRAHAFYAKYYHDPKIAYCRQGVWFLDIGYANYRQLIESGVLPSHIDAPATCTSCQIDAFYSYRKDSVGTYGEMMAVVGLK